MNLTAKTTGELYARFDRLLGTKIRCRQLADQPGQDRLALLGEALRIELELDALRLTLLERAQAEPDWSREVHPQPSPVPARESF